MDDRHFDIFARPLSGASARRGLVRGLAATMLGFATVRIPGAVAGKKKRKESQPNAFGCLNVGQKCRGNDALCCSGICRGKKPKKGQKDKRTCAAHNTGGCIAEQDSCALEQNVPCLSNGGCLVTTGQATFCGELGGGTCIECTKDADCLLFGPGAACVVCPSACHQDTTACFAAAF
jgi:hypothetical protein